jgi:putative chitinase
VAKYADALEETFGKYEINTALRQSHFLSQVLHESGRLLWMKEIWGPTRAQLRYEGRADLGNTQPGDGKRYMGRGAIQLTGRSNYQQYANAIGTDVVANPGLVSQLPLCIDVAGWYWDTRNLNRWADMDNIREVTRRVNGGLNGLAERTELLRRAKSFSYAEEQPPLDPRPPDSIDLNET